MIRFLLSECVLGDELCLSLLSEHGNSASRSVYEWIEKVKSGPQKRDARRRSRMPHPRQNFTTDKKIQQAREMLMANQ